MERDKVILDKLKKTVRAENLFASNDTLLIAYSGGLDSTGLLLLLLELRKEWPIKLFLGHFNHKIRPGSDKDEAFVRKMAAQKSLEIFTGSADVPAFARKHKLNLEEAGRILRYDFLKKTAGKLGNAKIATGHTMTDQAETFLMRMLRGSGLKGLAGIPPMRDGNIIRPLLSIEREEIRTFLGERGAAYCCDESNKDLSFFRNRIRAELLPYLRENFDPKIVRRISKMTSLVREDECLLEQLTKDTARGVFIQKKEGLCLDMGSLSFLPLALQRRLARNFLFRIKDNLKGISFGDVDRILELKEGGELYLPGGLVLKRERGMLVDRSTLSTECIYRYSWSGQEKLEIRELCMSVSGKIHIESGADSLFSDDRMSACLDRDRLRFPLTVRNRAAGDRYQPFGAPGSKKLKEIMRAKGIPPSERDAHPVFLSGEDIVWVQGLPVSESFKVSDSTHEVFMISIKS